MSPRGVVQDTWSTLVAGRLVAASGIPHRELLTAWAHGRPWVDQQWLAQLLFYRAERLGGMTAVVAFSVLLSGLAWVGAIAYIRRRGASGGSLVFWGTATLLVAPWALQVRAQSLALPLFVALLALVFADSRGRSPRIFLALPILALWGNIHGTAFLGACILALHAFVTLVEATVTRTRVGPVALRAAALAGGGVLALAANPYGLGAFSYYRTMIFNPPFAGMIGEWKHAGLATNTVAFYALALVAIGIGTRHRRRLTSSEVAVALFLFAAAVDAIRSIIWFALAALVLLPPLLRMERPPKLDRLAAPARVGVLVGTVAVLAGTLSSPAPLSRDWSMPGSAALRAALAVHPTALVAADDHHADFLLWEIPALQGRVLADVRFELLTRSEIMTFRNFESRPGPANAPSARFVVLYPKQEALAPWRHAKGWKQLFSDATLAVYERRAA